MRRRISLARVSRTLSKRSGGRRTKCFLLAADRRIHVRLKRTSGRSEATRQDWGPARGFISAKVACSVLELE